MFQVETVDGSTAWSEYSPYHLDCDFAGLKNWSFVRPLASGLREGNPSTRVMSNLLSFLHNQSFVCIYTDTFPGTGSSGPVKGLSSDEILELSMSEMSDQPINDLMPLIISLYVCQQRGTDRVR